ncbi:hypothetical protein [Oleidesulfovibrio sp.]|uniref:hypothetical protein n=1 Tax=Oleidesulfovibrio sp. TaxID=2909707 RepID=UPI003A8AFECA
MRIYYKQNRLYKNRTGNDDRLSVTDNLLYLLSAKKRSRLISLNEVNSVLFNKHHSIGCSIKAPLWNVGWYHQPQWYELFKGEQVYLPQCVLFTDGSATYAVVVIEGELEIRIWRDPNRLNRSKEDWFSHEPLVLIKELNLVRKSFDVLLKHIQKEDAYEARSPKFP